MTYTSTPSIATTSAAAQKKVADGEEARDASIGFI
jgi:hypothetical protein